MQLLKSRISSFEVFPFSLPAISGIDSLKLHPQVTFLVGDNGSGKSTLLEAIAVAFGLNPEGGSKNFSFSTRASHSELGSHLRLVKGIHRPRDSFFFRAESLFNLATEIENLDREPGFGNRIIDSYGGHSLHEQSHGESFLAVVANRLGSHGLYLMDEPESALSPMRQLTLVGLIHRLVERGSQLIIATHSPILIAYPNSLVYELSGRGIHLVDYSETELFSTHSGFLQNPDLMMKRIINNMEI